MIGSTNCGCLQLKFRPRQPFYDKGGGVGFVSKYLSKRFEFWLDIMNGKDNSGSVFVKKKTAEYD